MATIAAPPSGYGLELPTGAEAVASLARIHGADAADQLWSSACRAVGAPPRTDLPLDQIKAVAAHLKSQPGITAVIGGSLLVRANTYELLSKKAVA